MIYTTYFENYEEYERLFPPWPTERFDTWDTGVNVHGGKVTFLDKNLPIIQKLDKELTEICNDYFLKNSIKIKFVDLYKLWVIQYEAGAYHDPHIHNKNYTVIVSFDNIDIETFFVNLPSGHEIQFKDVAGELRILESGNLWHGVYPVPVRRRVLVLEYVYETIKNPK